MKRNENGIDCVEEKGIGLEFFFVFLKQNDNSPMLNVMLCDDC